MLGGIRSRLTFSNVVAVIALFCALGGGAYAAATLPKNSVGTKQLKKGAVTNAKLGKNAVTGNKVKDQSLTGADINLGTLPKVGSAANADNAGHAGTADNATHATNADNATNAGHATNADNLAAPEDWHNVGAPGEPAFQNGAINDPSGTPLFDFPPVAFYKDKEGVVHLRGVVKLGSSDLIFTLPAGYTPGNRHLLVLNAYCGGCGSASGSGSDPQGGSVSVTVTTNQSDIVLAGSGIDPSIDNAVIANGSSGDVVVLDGVSFRAGE